MVFLNEFDGSIYRKSMLLCHSWKSSSAYSRICNHCFKHSLDYACAENRKCQSDGCSWRIASRLMLIMAKSLLFFLMVFSLRFVWIYLNSCGGQSILWLYFRRLCIYTNVAYLSIPIFLFLFLVFYLYSLIIMARFCANESSGAYFCKSTRNFGLKIADSWPLLFSILEILNLNIEDSGWEKLKNYWMFLPSGSVGLMLSNFFSYWAWLEWAYWLDCSLLIFGDDAKYMYYASDLIFLYTSKLLWN